ncbi:uncharacterized protein LOC128395269 [Panonychus citri]|uniref:uncharacterized protein LOC128395269 n=1 Tax=Panonychus citri TaxID=50023 RepID=UPI0023073796|nr:uncharacterized protein LOC128395269 [Panonychus citri]
MRGRKIDESLLINRLIEKVDTGQGLLFGYEEEKTFLQNVIKTTIESGESESVIIFGPSGSGKSCLLEATLSKLNIGESTRRSYIIRLDGLIHTTDALALSVIGKVLEIELTNSSQIGLALQDKISSVTRKKTFIFILNHIDVFCRRQQTLLYTLFDAIHNVNGLCLVGLTAKTDCTDYLEKRVRSRILYKTIVLTTPFKSYKDYYDYVNNYLEGAIEADLLKSLVSWQYKKSATPGSMKKFLLDLLYNYENLKIHKNQLTKDHKIDRLESITYLELAIICLVAKRLNQTKKQTFRPIEIHQLLGDIPSQITSSKDLFLHVLSRLIDYGLVNINNNQRSNSYISDWSSLSLNVEMEQIKTVIRLRQAELPTNFNKVLDTNA